MTPPLSPDQLDGRAVSVLGAARSGVAAARLLAGHGARVFVSEYGAMAEPAREALAAAGIPFEDGGHSDRVLEADFVVVSPGVPTQAPVVQEALRRGLPVWGELEVASWFCAGPMLAVTGSNGKTTTTSLLGHVAQRSGRPTVVAGNIGRPLADAVGEITPETLVVLEVSSFQLDHVATYRPRVAVLLNVTPDHLDRYDGSFEAYAAAKLRLFAHQRAGDAVVYNHDDPVLRAAVAGRPEGVRALGVSLEAEVPEGAFLRDEQLVLRLATDSPTPMDEPLMPMHELSLRGRHNLYNSLAGAVAARAMEISSDVIRESLASFEGVPHRLERVREVGGVTYVNDSKATNVNALWYALESFAEPIVLIAGGRDKGNDYEPVKMLVGERCRAVIGVGESGDKVLLELGGLVGQSARAQTLQEALQYAQLMAEPGDVVLLSPACASFDQFENYEDRGDTFKRLVHAI